MGEVVGVRAGIGHGRRMSPRRAWGDNGVQDLGHLRPRVYVEGRGPCLIDRRGDRNPPEEECEVRMKMDGLSDQAGGKMGRGENPSPPNCLKRVLQSELQLAHGDRGREPIELTSQAADGAKTRAGRSRRCTWNYIAC